MALFPCTLSLSPQSLPPLGDEPEPPNTPCLPAALIVRLLTGRFIGEYDPTLEAVYSYQIPLPGHTLPLQVMDTAGHVSSSPGVRPGCSLPWNSLQ